MKHLRMTLLLIAAIVICLSMLRLGVWQLDRAAQKQAMLDQVQVRVEQAPVDIRALIDGMNENTADHRFQNVVVTGHYAADKSIYLDNQVRSSVAGFSVLTPFQIESSDWWVLVDRGWLAGGASRSQLPSFDTQQIKLSLNGRLNIPASKPAMWRDSYAVSDGALWQYLPIAQLSDQLQLKLLPLVVELAPDQEANQAQFIHQWAEIDDQWVAKHKGYAFQWFAMALAFLIACIVLIVRVSRRNI